MYLEMLLSDGSLNTWTDRTEPIHTGFKKNWTEFSLSTSFSPLMLVAATYLW